LKIARAMHEKYPDDIRGAMTLARDEITRGKPDRAVEIFEELLAVEPNNAEAYNQVGYYYAYRGAYDKALENMRKYQFMAPDQANPYDSLGEIQAFSGHYDEAIQNLEHALSLKPDFWAGHQHLGVAYEGKGDVARAVEFYRKGAQEAVSDGMRRQLLQQARRAAIFGRDKAAVEQISGEIEALPQQPYSEVDRIATRAIEAYMDGRWTDAEKDLHEVRTMLEAFFAKEKMKNDEHGKFYDAPWNYLMARVLDAQGRREEAIVLCRQLVDPPQPWGDFESRRWVYEGRALLAELVARQGDLDGAEKLLAENRKWNPSWAPSRSCEQVVAQLRREKVLAASK
jgi:tetratricopeptide (TPR) repeat protein